MIFHKISVVWLYTFVKFQSTLLTFGFAFSTFERCLQNFGFIHTDLKFWSFKLGNGESSKNQYCSYLLKPEFKTSAHVIKLFNVVIFCHSMVIPSLRVSKLHYHRNYHWMAVYYRGKDKVSISICTVDLHLKMITCKCKNVG